MMEVGLQTGWLAVGPFVQVENIEMNRISNNYYSELLSKYI